MLNQYYVIYDCLHSIRNIKYQDHSSNVIEFNESLVKDFWLYYVYAYGQLLHMSKLCLVHRDFGIENAPDPLCLTLFG